LTLDAPKQPTEPSQCYDLLLFFFAQDIARGDGVLVAVNVSGVVTLAGFG
jgi:hypothetical protein